MNKLARQIATWRQAKGFYTPPSLATMDNRDAMLGKLMLVVTEVSEAAEAVRHNDIWMAVNRKMPCLGVIGIGYLVK